MVICVYGVQQVLPPSVPTSLALMILIGCGILTYIAAISMLARPMLLEIITFLSPRRGHSLVD